MFAEWPSDGIERFSFGGKKFLNYKGAPVFAEIYVLRLLQAHGWDGVWVSSFGRKYLRDMPTDWGLSNHIDLVPVRQATLDKIMPSGEGCFDVFAWRDSEVLFCECKRRTEDDLRETQKKWIDAALDSGFGSNNFLAAEWSIKT
jgi:hypothetical protein